MSSRRLWSVALALALVVLAFYVFFLPQVGPVGTTILVAAALVAVVAGWRLLRKPVEGE